MKTVAVFDSFSDTDKGASSVDLVTKLTAEGIAAEDKVGINRQTTFTMYNFRTEMCSICEKS